MRSKADETFVIVENATSLTKKFQLGLLFELLSFEKQPIFVVKILFDVRGGHCECTDVTMPNETLRSLINPDPPLINFCRIIVE